MDSLFSTVDLDQELLALEKEKKKEEKSVPVEEKKEEEFDKTLFIVDGYSLIYRSYFAFLTRPLTDKEGNNVSAFFGFFNTVFMLLREYSFDYFVIALDSPGKTFRHEMYPAYKGTRDKAPDELHTQVPVIMETLRKMNIPTIGREGYEADDLIATLAANATRLGVDTVMVTADKDLLQIVNSHVRALRPPKKNQPKYELFGVDEVKQAFSIMPSQIRDYLTLLGDASDNVPGVKGIGEKTAVTLLQEYVSVDGIYRHLDSLAKGLRGKLEAGREDAELSKRLVTLKDDIFTLESFDTPEFSVATIDFGAGVEDFVARNCSNLARTALSMTQGDRKQLMKDAVKKSEEASRSVTAPQEYLGVGSYTLLTDIKVIRAYFESAKRSTGVIAFDTETTDVEISGAEFVGFSFSYELKKAFYCPLIAKGERYLETDDVIALFRDYFETGALKVVGQNIKYDIELLGKYGVTIKNVVFDTMIAAWLLDSGDGRYSLDDLASRYLSYDTIHFDDIVPKGQDFSSVSLEDALAYSGEDSDLTYRLYLFFSEVLKRDGLDKVMEEYELPLISVLVEMERNGVLLDKAFMAELDTKLSDRLDALTKRIHDEAGHEFNINSSVQLAKVLFEEKGLEAVKKTQRGFSTDTATLEALRGKDPMIEDLLEYRGVSKLLSTYVDALPRLCDESGRIHTSYLQTGTATGRLSSRNPNLQNIPIRTDDGRMIRSAFVAGEGMHFLSADYSQIELVMLAHISGDEELTKAFREGADIHRYTAGLIFSKSADEVTPADRRIAKTINFGIMYGMSPFRLSNELGISRSDAKSFIERYFERYSGIRAFVDETVRSCEEKGYVTTMGGHRRSVAAINSRNKNEKSAAERVAVNTVIQGSAAELMKKAMTAIHGDLKDRGLKSRILLQVHDELILEVPDGELDEVAALVRDRMENAAQLSVPLRAGIESGKRWGDMH